MGGRPARHIDRQSMNLGWSYPELALPDRIVAAAAAGFRHIECHFPYQWPAATLAETMRRAGVTMLSINAPHGNGQLGLAAIEGAEELFERSIAEAVVYAGAIGAPMIHVLCGFADDNAANEARVVRNLQRVAGMAAARGIRLLLEPLNHVEEPGYFLHTVPQAARILRAVGAPNVRMMFDCYHASRTEPDVFAALAAHLDLIAHIQIAATPSHAEPDEGTLDYNAVYDLLDRIGYTGRIGAEYVPRGATADGLGWMDALGIIGREQAR